MGASFTNLQIRNTSSKAILAALPKLMEGRGYVSSQKGGWVTVYSEAMDEQGDETKRLAGELSKVLKTEVFGFQVFDSDIAMYWLYRNGEMLDEFNSSPDYFEGEKDEEAGGSGGNPEIVLPLCVGGATREQLQEILHPADGYPVMAEDIVGELAKLLGMDDTRAMLGFTYFEEEGEDIMPDAADFEPVGVGAERKESNITEVDFQQAAAVMPDFYPLAINMLTQIWNPKYTGEMSAAFAMFGEDTDTVMNQMRDAFDRSARDLLKKSRFTGLPTIEELKTARNEGPAALAELIARKTPGQVTEIGIGAATYGLTAFVGELLKRGLDPTAANAQSRTTLDAAEQEGKDSAIYRLVKGSAK